MGVFLFVNPENMAYRNYGKTDKKPTECLFVGNIPFDYQEEDIRDIFRSLGNLKKITMGRDRMTGRPKGHAFVEFYEIQDATEAFETLQGKEVSGRVLRLDYDAGLNRKHTGPSRGSRDGRDDRYDPYHRSSRPERSRSPRDRYARRSPDRRYGEHSRQDDRGSRRAYSPARRDRRSPPPREEPRGYQPSNRSPRREGLDDRRRYDDSRSTASSQYGDRRRRSPSPSYEAPYEQSSGGGSEFRRERTPPSTDPAYVAPPVVHPSRMARNPPALAEYHSQGAYDRSESRY